MFRPTIRRSRIFIKFPTMRTLLISIGLLILIFFGIRATPAHASTYTYYRAITVTSTASIASGTNTNFPMLVSSTLSSWEPVADGGHIQNLCTAPNGGQEPCDLVFATSSANCNLTPLSFETESYTSSTGALIDWVNVPSLSAGTAIYACYDNASIATDQSHPSSTWNANYGAVYHLGNGNGLSLLDSTFNGESLTNQGAVAGTTGQIDGAGSFSGSNELYASSTVATSFGNNITLEAWVFATSISNGADDIITKFDGCDSSQDYFFYTNGGVFFYYDCAAQNSLGVTLPLNTWTDAVLTINNASATLYTNGNLASVTTLAGGTNTNVGNASVFDVGSYDINGGEFWQGTIDEARMSSVVLSPSWILTDYNNESSPATFYSLGSETLLGGGGSSSPPGINSSSTDFFVRGGPGSIFGNSQSTDFEDFNDGEVLALPIMQSTDFDIISGIIRPIFQPVKPTYTQIHYQWRNDNGSETSASSATGGIEDTTLTGLAQNTSIRVRMEITNAGGTIFSYAAQSFQLQYGELSTTCSAISSWTVVGGAGATWSMYNSSNLTDGANTTDIATSTGGLIDMNHTFIVSNAGVKTTTSTVTAILVPSDSFIETEFDVQALSSSTPGATYCFRMTNTGSATNFSYAQYPEATLSSGSQSITLTLNTSTVNLPALGPGIAVSATTTATVNITGSPDGYTMDIQRNSATSTLASSSITFPDATVWNPSSTSCAAGIGNATATLGQNFSFRVESSTTSANYCSFWWGASDSGGTAMYAGVPSTTQPIVYSTSTASQNGTTTVQILYSANAPVSQKATSYTGGVTITVLANP